MKTKQEFEFLLHQVKQFLEKNGDELKRQAEGAIPILAKELSSLLDDLKTNWQEYTESPERKRIFDVVVKVATEQLPLSKMEVEAALDAVLNENDQKEQKGSLKHIAQIQSWLIQVSVSYIKVTSNQYKATTTIFFDIKAPKRSINTETINRTDLPAEVREKFFTTGENEVSVVLYQMGGE